MRNRRCPSGGSGGRARSARRCRSGAYQKGHLENIMRENWSRLPSRLVAMFSLALLAALGPSVIAQETQFASLRPFKKKECEAAPVLIPAPDCIPAPEVMPPPEKKEPDKKEPDKKEEEKAPATIQPPVVEA